MRSFRRNLAKFITEKRGNQPLRDFARHCGLSKTTVSRIEKEEQNVTIDTLEHLCKVFHCDIQDLFPR